MAINNPYVPGDPYSYDLKWIVAELKKAIDLYTPISQEVQDLYDFVHTYFESTRFEEQLDAALRVLASDGTLAEIIQPLFDEYKIDVDTEISNMINRINGQDSEIAVLSARMDTFSNLPTGSTAGDAELMDIRVGYDGTTYATAGDAVRGGDQKLQDQIDVYGMDDLNQFYNRTGATSADVAYNYDALTDTFSAIGTASGTSVFNLFNEATFVHLKADTPYHIKFASSDPKIYLQVYYYVGGTSTIYRSSVKDEWFKFPANATGCIIRARTTTGANVNATFTFKIYGAFTPDALINRMEMQSMLLAVDDENTSENYATNMQPRILAALNTYGYCKLGTGVYYITAIEMPEGSTLEGNGEKTVIKLLDSQTASTAIIMHKFNTVKNLRISGSFSDIDVSTLGGRVGIDFVANHDGNEGGTQYDSETCMISDIWIDNFDKAGIRCHNTTANYAKGLYANNVKIYNCRIGLDIDYYSEFNKFTNFNISWCYYACRNSGGNNAFTACTFHATNTGLYMDGTQPNAGHGMVTNCNFCHIGNNTGVAINMVSVGYGFVFSNCQFWYNDIRVVGCSGVTFTGCEFGRGTTSAGQVITVSGGNLVMFDGCMFYNDGLYAPQITVTSNTKTKFTNCYGTVTGNQITA